MRFLIAFAAFVAYASASAIIAPYAAWGVNPGDAQAAAIDANVAAIDHARAINENHARASEAVVQHQTEAVRQAAEATRDLHENAYWNGVAHSQNLVAAAQSQAAAINGAHAAYAAQAYAAPVVAAPWGVHAAAPLAYGHYW